jgi:hypothetical protein
MAYLKCKYLIKIIAQFWIIFFLNFAHASESEELKLSSENYFAINLACDSYDLIDGNKYCLKESMIPLNSCGEQSDWPCMDPEGCLGITQFIKE